MSRFKVGQKVVRLTDCIPHSGAHPVYKDHTYTIREIEFDEPTHAWLLSLEGIINPICEGTGKEYAYDERCFAPVIESHSEFVEVSYEKIKESNPKVSAS